uniref:GDT1 family protein n=1 Tax=Eutreptiella gymnastica TaxID=73025 RepID=A0A7S4LFL3_9EUGL
MQGDFVDGFLSSLFMIIVTELGDKTFFIAAIMAMRYARLTVFIGAILALAVMTILSAAMGYMVPALIPVKYTQLLAFALFAYFGIRLLRDAWAMGPGEDDEEPEEMKEAAETLNKKRDVEDPEPLDANGNPVRRRKMGGNWSLEYFVATLASPIFAQAFSLTFLAEWGDRSQIATIAMAAAKNPYAVTLGGIFGHSLCTGLAVIGGRLLAQKISPRTVSYLGGVLFLVFAFATLAGHGG